MSVPRLSLPPGYSAKETAAGGYWKRPEEDKLRLSRREIMQRLTPITRVRFGSDPGWIYWAQVERDAWRDFALRLLDAQKAKAAAPDGSDGPEAAAAPEGAAG